MKNVVSFIFLLALLVSGCTQDEMLRNGTSASGGRIFTTSFENDESRTYVEDGHLLRWTAGDQISLFDGNTLPLQYQFKGWTGNNAGTFYMVSKPEGNGSPLNHNYAVYPYAQDVKVSKEGVLTATLPSKQHYAMNSFGLGDNTMVAVTRNVDDLFLNFKNVGGFLKLQLYGDDVTVKSITLTGNNGEKIAGEATLAVGYDEVPMVSMADSAATSITLDCGENGVKLGTSEEEATEFWIVVPPTVFEKGFTVKVRDFENGVFIQTTDKKQVIERNVVKPMTTVKAVMEEEFKTTDFMVEKDIDGWNDIITFRDGQHYFFKYGEDSERVEKLFAIVKGDNEFVPVCAVFDENEVPVMVGYDDVKIYITRFDETKADFIIYKNDSIFGIVKDAPHEFQTSNAYSRGYRENNATRNITACLLMVAGIGEVGAGVTVIAASGVAEVFTAGAATPAAVIGAVGGALTIASGCQDFQKGLELLLGSPQPPTAGKILQAQALMSLGLTMEGADSNSNLNKWLKDASGKNFDWKTLSAGAKLGFLSLLLNNIDMIWGETIDKNQQLNTFLNDLFISADPFHIKVSSTSAELGVDILIPKIEGFEMEYETGIICFETENPSNRFSTNMPISSDGFKYVYKLTELKPDTEYTYFPYFRDITHLQHRFGTQMTFETNEAVDLSVNIKEIKYENSPHYDTGTVFFEPTITININDVKKLDHLLDWGIIIYENNSTEIERIQIGKDNEGIEITREFKLSKSDMDIDYTKFIAKNNKKYSIGAYVVEKSSGEELESNTIVPIELVYNRKPEIRFVDARVISAERLENNMNWLDWDYDYIADGVLFIKNYSGATNQANNVTEAPVYYSDIKFIDEHVNTGKWYGAYGDGSYSGTSYYYFKATLGNGDIIKSKNRIASVLGFPGGSVKVVP